MDRSGARTAGTGATSACGSGCVGTAERPRLVVYRSLKHIYAQLVDDDRGMALLGVTDTSDGHGAATGRRQGRPRRARSASCWPSGPRTAGIAKVVFDRGGYQYHGRVKAVAEGAREGGLEF